MEQLRFDGRVAIVTGAGGNPGLGRSYAMLLAARGARVVVNDLGVGTDGRGTMSPRAEAVVAEIVAAGGEAVADANSVAEEEGAQAIVQTALDAWGRVDVLINNASITHVALFDELSSSDLAKIVQVHLFGSIWMCRAAWPQMKEQRYGRIINVSSGSIVGFPYAVTYGAAKAGVYGLTRALAAEGKELGIVVNALGPIANTAGTAHMFEQVEIDGIDDSAFDPDLVAPTVAVLAHESCGVSGKFINSGMGHLSEYYLAETAGYTNAAQSPEDVRDNLAKVVDRDGAHAVPDPGAEPPGAVFKPKPYRPDPSPAA